MPIYIYECTNPMCYHIDELHRPFRSIDDPVECSECGSKSQRVLSAPAMSVVKGTWKSNISASGRTNCRCMPIKHPTREKNVS